MVLTACISKSRCFSDIFVKLSELVLIVVD